MKHRHLVDGVGYTPAAVEDVLDRGKPPDWAALRDVVVADPRGTVKQTVLDVCRSTYMYGTPSYGVRNLIRAQPIDVETYETSAGPIVLPTLSEMTRVKTWLSVTRNATRDYVDFVALADRIEIKSGIEGFTDALSPMDRLYPQANGTSVVLQLAKQLAEPRPKDLGDGDLSVYRLIADRWKDWDVVKRAAERYGVILLEEFARRQ